VLEPAELAIGVGSLEGKRGGQERELTRDSQERDIAQVLRELGVLRRVREIPGVEAAGITDALPLGRNRTWGSRAKGVTYERGKAPTAYVRVVSDGYLAALGIPLKAGRDIAPSDTATSVLMSRGAVRAGRMIETDFLAFQHDARITEARHRTADSSGVVGGRQRNERCARRDHERSVCSASRA